MQIPFPVSNLKIYLIIGNFKYISIFVTISIKFWVNLNSSDMCVIYRVSWFELSTFDLYKLLWKWKLHAKVKIFYIENLKPKKIITILNQKLLSFNFLCFTAIGVDSTHCRVQWQKKHKNSLIPTLFIRYGTISDIKIR